MSSIVNNVGIVQPDSLVSRLTLPKVSNLLSIEFLDSFFSNANYTVAGTPIGNIPTNRGDVINVPRIDNFSGSDNGVDFLKEGVTPDASTLEVTNVPVRVHYLGGWLGHTEEQVVFSDIPAVSAAVKKLGVSASLKCQYIMRGALSETLSIHQASGGSNTSTSKITAIGIQDLKRAVQSLRMNHVKTFTDFIMPSTGISTRAVIPSYLLFACPQVVNDIEALTGFRSVETYAQPEQRLPNEVGTIEGVRILLDTLEPQVRNISGDIVYKSLLVGHECMLYTGDSTNGTYSTSSDGTLPLRAEFKCKPGTDPLDRMFTVGVKCVFGAKLTDSRTCIAIHSTSAFT